MCVFARASVCNVFMFGRVRKNTLVWACARGIKNSGMLPIFAYGDKISTRLKQTFSAHCDVYMNILSEGFPQISSFEN